MLSGAFHPFDNETNLNYTKQSTQDESELRITRFYIYGRAFEVWLANALPERPSEPSR
jgi:hypothetical protein